MTKSSSFNPNVMPEAEVYEQELRYMPYRESLERVTDIIRDRAPQDARLLDLMCGTGHLLGEISKIRKDMKLVGVDIDSRYISHADFRYRSVLFETGDVLTWEPPIWFNIVTCTGALHHVPYELQETAIKRMSEMITPEGFVIISDCYIDDYNSESERGLAAAKLGYEYLIAMMKNGAPRDAISGAIDIMRNDVLMDEFKTSLKRRMPAFERAFGRVETFKTWPKEETEYGDYITVLRNPLEVGK